MNFTAKKYLLFSIYAFATLTGKCNVYHIKFISNIYPITIELYRFENNVKQEFIEQIYLPHDTVYSRNIEEYDSYIVNVDKDKRDYFFFLWDGDVEIEINNKNVYLSKIKNSAVTFEYNNYVDSMQNLIFRKIRKLDTALINLERKGYKISDIIYKETKMQRNELIGQGPSMMEQFIRDYLKLHPDSFVALYYFDRAGYILSDGERNLLKKMPAELRKNHRYIRVMDR